MEKQYQFSTAKNAESFRRAVTRLGLEASRRGRMVTVSAPASWPRDEVYDVIRQAFLKARVLPQVSY